MGQDLEILGIPLVGQLMKMFLHQQIQTEMAFQMKMINVQIHQMERQLIQMDVQILNWMMMEMELLILLTNVRTQVEEKLLMQMDAHNHN